MTSKEALERLWNIANVPDKDGYLPLPSLFNIIKKDLEVLEILKNKSVDVNLIKNIMKEHREFEFYPEFNLTREEFNKIKEWLERWRYINSRTKW